MEGDKEQEPSAFSMRYWTPSDDPQKKIPGPPTVEQQGRVALNMGDFQMMNVIGHWLQQSGVVSEDENGVKTYASVLDNANRVKANKVFGELMDRFSTEIKTREGN